MVILHLEQGKGKKSSKQREQRVQRSWGGREGESDVAEVKADHSVVGQSEHRGVRWRVRPQELGSAGPWGPH